MWLFRLSDGRRRRPPEKVLPVRVSSHLPDCFVARLANEQGHSTRLAPRIEADETETRPMGDCKIRSSYTPRLK